MAWRQTTTGMAAAFAALPASALAATCPQERAVYRDADSAYELVFRPGESEAEATSHQFTVKVLNTPVVLDGYVMPSRPLNRSNGIVFYNCPEGDVTGKDIAACTVWEDVIYSHSEGNLDLLPPEGADAAKEILLPGFGPAIRNSKAWGSGKASVAPWDVMELKGCTE